MFEKEAEEYRESKRHKSFRADVGTVQINYECYLNNLQSAFKDGAEFAYNKANEWHKPSEKLPEECSLVLAYLFEETEPTLCEYVVSNQWECLPRRFVFCSNDQVRLWKEIVLPKEIKEK